MYGNPTCEAFGGKMQQHLLTYDVLPIRSDGTI